MSEFLSNLYTFKGRLGRLGFIWKFIVIMASILFFALVMAFGTTAVASIAPIAGLIFMALMYIFILSLGFIPPVAITARRLHDIGLSGWWQLLPNLMLSAFFGLIVASFLSSGMSITPEQLQNMNEQDVGLLIMESLSGTYAILAFICLAVVPLFGFMLLLWPGTKGPNKFDEGVAGFGFHAGGSINKNAATAGHKYLVNFSAALPEESMYLIKHLKENNTGISKITMPQDRASAVIELSNTSGLNPKKIKKIFSEIGFPIKSVFKEN